MNDKLESAQHTFIESIGSLCGVFGMNKFVAQLYALLYLSDRPLSLDEMMARLKVSKGNVSINIRELEKWGAVKNIWVKGSRKDYYEANLDVKSVVLNKLKSGMQKRLNETSEMISEFNGILDGECADLSEEEKRIMNVYRERIKKIEGLKASAVGILKIADTLI